MTKTEKRRRVLRGIKSPRPLKEWEKGGDFAFQDFSAKSVQRISAGAACRVMPISAGCGGA